MIRVNWLRDIWITLAVLLGTSFLLMAGVRWVQHRHAVAIEARLDALQPLLEKHAERTDLPIGFLRGIVRAESGGDPQAVSKKEARGLMQIRAAAEQDALDRLDVARGDIFDPDYNILIGSTYLGLLRDRFGPRWPIVATAYHMGPTRMQKMMDQHPTLTDAQLIEVHVNPTTRAYVRRVVVRH